MTMQNNKPTPSTEDRKHLPKFLLIMLVCTALGGVLGYNAMALNESGGPMALAAAFFKGLQGVVPIAGPLLCLALAGGSLWLYLRAKKQYRAWDGSDETDSVLEQCEKSLTWALLLSNLLMFAVYLLISLALITNGPGNALLCVGAAVLGLVAMLVLQQRIVALTKEICPEKHGSVFDTKFQSKWASGYDEAEKQRIGEASYAAMKATTYTCMGLWFLLLLGSIPFQYGPLPGMAVLVIWAVQTVSYTLACLRAGKRKK